MRDEDDVAVDAEQAEDEDAVVDDVAGLLEFLGD